MIAGRSHTGMGDAAHAEAFDGICQMALRHVESARILRVLATGEFLAEVPRNSWDFWALGKTEEEARQELLKVVCRKLQDRLRARTFVQAEEVSA